MNRPASPQSSRDSRVSSARSSRGGSPPRRPQRPPAASPTLLGQTDPGPRPVTARQQETRAQGRLTGSDIIDRTIPPRAKSAPPVERKWRESPNRRHVRDAQTTQIRRRRARPEVGPAVAAARNRKRISRWPRLLRVSLVVLAVETVAVLCLSPRFWATRTEVEGNKLVPTDRLLSDLAVPPHRTLTLLRVSKMRAAVLDEPQIESAEIHRRPPGTVQLVVVERKPWANVCLPDGGCYIIDRKLVPFRSLDAPDSTLPRIVVVPDAPPAPPLPSSTGIDAATAAGPAANPAASPSPASGGDAAPNAPAIAASGAGDDAAPINVELGKPLPIPGLDSVATCLRWAAQNRVPLASVEIAPDGELCLNRRGGLRVRLGSAVDLDRKLNAFALLLERRPSLRDVSGDSADYVNLLAYEAPAVHEPSTAAKGSAVKKPGASVYGNGAHRANAAVHQTPPTPPALPAATVTETTAAAADTPPAARSAASVTTDSVRPSASPPPPLQNSPPQ